MLRVACVVGLVICACSAFAWTTVYDSQGFTTAPLGSIMQVSGWYGYGNNNDSPPGPPGTIPTIVDRSDGNRCLEFKVPDAYLAESYAMIYFPQVSSSTGALRVAFDIYRQPDAWTSNSRWMLFPYMYSGPIPFGAQWDQANGHSATYPLGWDGPRFTTIMGAWTSVQLTYDFDTHRATAVYNGNQIGAAAFPDVAPAPYYALALDLFHEEAAGSGPETMWVDNIRVLTPEPTGAVALVALGLLAGRIRRS